MAHAWPGRRASTCEQHDLVGQKDTSRVWEGGGGGGGLCWDGAKGALKAIDYVTAGGDGVKHVKTGR